MSFNVQVLMFNFYCSITFRRVQLPASESASTNVALSGSEERLQSTKFFAISRGGGRLTDTTRESAEHVF